MFNKDQPHSTPENDRDKRKAALQAARQKLALRKKQREELRAQRAARLDGKIDTLAAFTANTASAKAASSSIQKLNQSSQSQTIKKPKKKPLLDLDDFKESKSSASNRASLLRAPRKYVIVYNIYPCTENKDT